MKKIFLLLMFFLFSATVFAADFCEVDINKWDWASWEKCNRKEVKFTGEIAQMVHAHRMGFHDTLDRETHKIIEKVHNYIDIPGHQLVVTYDRKFECDFKIEIQGIVDVVEFEVEEGVVGLNYRNIWIEATSYTCKD